MSDRVAEKTDSSGELKFEFHKLFSESDKKTWNDALNHFVELDATPATNDELQQIKAILKREPPETLGKTLRERAASANARLNFRGRPKAESRGAAALTTLAVDWESTLESDSSPGTFLFALHGIPTERRREARWNINVKAYLPTGDLGMCLEAIVHELAAHGEPYLDSIEAYRMEEKWVQPTAPIDHWMLAQRGVPRYLLYQLRLQKKYSAELLTRFKKGMTDWNEAQQEAARQLKAMSEKEKLEKEMDWVTKSEQVLQQVRHGGLSVSTARELAQRLDLWHPSYEVSEGIGAKPSEALMKKLQPEVEALCKQPALWWCR